MEQVMQSDSRRFLLEKILKNPTGHYSPEESELLALARRDKVSRPVIYIGTGSCGMSAGADKTLDAIRLFLEEQQVDAELVETGCAGLCSEEPVMSVQLPGKARVSFRKVTPDKVEEILLSTLRRSLIYEHVLCQHRHSRHEHWANIPSIEQLPFFALQQRVILKKTGSISPWSIEEYLAHGGYRSLYKTVLNYTPEKVCEYVEQSGLRGRGGGGYPTGRKWHIALTTAGDQKYCICNAEESDPGGFMDRAIIEGDPHRLLEGLAIAAYAIGASNAYIFVRSDYPRAVSLLQEAIRQAKECEILGSNIFGSGFNLNITIRQSAGAFVCGEETALIQSIEGKRGIPWAKPPYPAEAGLHGSPTIINNVETLANIPSIMEEGPAWYRSLGTKTSSGTKLFSLTGKVQNSGFVEVPMGMQLFDIIYSIGGGIRDNHQLKAVQIGGPLGVCIPASELKIGIGFDSMHDVGAVLGSGGLIALDETVCMVDLSRYYMEFLQKESCGKCIPCREGTHRMLEIIDGITHRPLDETSHETLERFKGVVQLEGLAGVIKDTSLCGLGVNAPNPVLSALKWFREEFEEHIFDRHCKAGVCRDLRSFLIDVDLCNGCNVCQKKCPENAIIGTIRMPHFIVDDKCTGCGICFESCKFNAITIK